MPLPEHKKDLLELQAEIAKKLAAIDLPKIDVSGGWNTSGKYPNLRAILREAGVKRIEYKYASYGTVYPCDVYYLSSDTAMDGVHFRVLPNNIPTRSRAETYFVHDGSAAKPYNVPRDTRVAYYHRTTGKLTITSSDKLTTWVDVTDYRLLNDDNFALFVVSKSSRAHRF